MKKIENNFEDYYYLTEEGKVYNSKTKHYIEPSKQHNFKLKTKEGKYRKIALKELYKTIYNRHFYTDNIENLEGENWKPIERTEELYWISDKGRVKSYKGYEAIILKPNNVNGYERVDIFQDGSRSGKLIHRLVAFAFLDLPKSMDMLIHHKNGVKSDNRKENLVWLTPAEHREAHKKMQELEKGE